MTMETHGQASWPEEYGALCAFVQADGRIKATPSSLSVPADARPEFYRLVEGAQAALATQVLGERAAQVEKLARRCADVRRRLVEAAGLSAFNLAPTLEHLLADPLAALAKPAFSLVLDGLQNGRPAEDVEGQAALTLPPFCDSLARSAYEAWAYYGIVAAPPSRAVLGRALSPTRWRCSPPKPTRCRWEARITSPERRMPEAVFQTADGRVFAMKSEAARELDYYGLRIVRRRDNSAGGNTAELMGHRVLLLYRLESVDDVGLICDRDQLLQLPSDLFCEVLAPRDLSTPAYVGTFVERINAVRSRRPVQVVTFDGEGDFPEGMLDDPTVAPVVRRVAGLDEGVLADIAHELDEQTENLQETEER